VADTFSGAVTLPTVAWPVPVPEVDQEAQPVVAAAMERTRAAAPTGKR
jgi:hypothetical protein